MTIYSKPAMDLRVEQARAVGFREGAELAKTEIERLRAALISIGILNASGKNYDPEIDKIIRSIAVGPTGDNR